MPKTLFQVPIHRMVKKITCLLTVGILPILFYVAVKMLLIESPIFAANQIYRIMYSSEDLERFYFQYQTELCLMENLSNCFVLGTKFLVTSFTNGLRILVNK